MATSTVNGQERGTSKIIEIADIETATIDGRSWDKPFAGGRTVDAVHRSVLLRFPSLVDVVAEAVRQGNAVAGATLALAYDGYEIVPHDYTCRDGLGRKMWTDNPPAWHIQAWPLRKPWFADPVFGPTFNAHVNGRRFWTRYGAFDATHDRHPDVLEAKELSIYAREASIDISRLLSTEMLAPDLGARLRSLEECGFLLRKVETYDARYRVAGDAYEWAVPTGGHGLKFGSARLIFTLKPTAATVSLILPLPLERDEMLKWDAASVPTAVVPSQDEVVERTAVVLKAGLEGRDTWQVDRIGELRRVGGDRVSPWADVAGARANEIYRTRLREVLAIPPRYWQGWGIQDDLLIFYAISDLLPAPVKDHLKDYWRAWLMPDKSTEELLHPQSRETARDWERTHDWRGRASFFRGGYNYAVSTQNFNHTAAMGALLGGALIDAPNAIADGRHGLEHLLLRFWTFLDGSTQEMLDQYYFSITLSAQKMFTDFAPAPIDRLMGRILVDRSMEMLTTLYHPKLHRLVSSSGRARLPGVLVEQDGIYGALHTVSRKGVANYLDKGPDATVQGMPVWGHDFPPGRVAIQSLASPWAPSWVAGLIDDKPVPFEETAADTIRGYLRPPLWRRAYLGRWYGLASADIRGGVFDLMGQWVRSAQPSAGLEDLGTLTVRYIVNKADLATTKGGASPQGGITLIYQSRNRAIVFAKPHSNLGRLREAAGPDGISRLATVIGLWNFAASPDWEIFVDEQRIVAFPHRLPAGQAILIRDGVAYLGILPFPSTDLGRDAEVEIGFGGGGKAEPSGAMIAPALTISIYNLDRGAATNDEGDWTRFRTQTYGGFVLEIGDVEEHGSFDGFARYLRANRLTANWNEQQKLLEVSYQSGSDLMEAAFGTDFIEPAESHFPIRPGQQKRAIPYRRLNGTWPYLPDGVERDTSWSQQGTTGRLEKNGAVLVTEPGRKSYLLADPLSGAVVGYNPLPDPQSWQLAAADGVVLRADGKVGLLRVEYRPWSKECIVDHAPKADQTGADMARTLTVSGLKQAPRVKVNGRPVAAVELSSFAGSAAGFQIPIV